MRVDGSPEKATPSHPLHVRPSPPHTPHASSTTPEKRTPSHPRHDTPSPPHTPHASLRGPTGKSALCASLAGSEGARYSCKRYVPSSPGRRNSRKSRHREYSGPHPAGWLSEAVRLRVATPLCREGSAISTLPRTPPPARECSVQLFGLRLRVEGLGLGFWGLTGVGFRV